MSGRAERLSRQIDVRLFVIALVRLLAVLMLMPGTLELAGLLLVAVDRRELLAAFDLMLELIRFQRGILGPVLSLADLSIFLDGLLPLHLRCLKDRAGEWIDLRHR